MVGPLDVISKTIQLNGRCLGSNGTEERVSAMRGPWDLGSLREFCGFHHHQPLGMFLGVFRAKKNTAYEFARLAGLMTDDRPTGGKAQGAGFIYSRDRIANGHMRTLSPPALT